MYDPELVFETTNFESNHIFAFFFMNIWRKVQLTQKNSLIKN